MNPYSNYTPKGTHIFVEPPCLDDLIVEHGQPHEPLLVNGKATQYRGADVSARAHRERTGEAAAAVRMALELADPETDWSPDGEAWDDTGYESRSAPIATSIPEDASEIGESAEEWWYALGYTPDGHRTHPVCSFEEIDNFNPGAAALRLWHNEDAREARKAVHALERYGRRAKKDVLAIREHIDAAIKAAEIQGTATADAIAAPTDAVERVLALAERVVDAQERALIACGEAAQKDADRAIEDRNDDLQELAAAVHALNTARGK